MLTGKRLALRKEAKISVCLQLSPCVCTHEQESKFFRFEKKKKKEKETTTMELPVLFASL
jgi:hypothetical protein